MTQPASDRSGAALAERYYHQVVAPLLERRWPGLEHAAGRLGTGSEVLRLDDAMSRDHDWGPQLTLLVPDPLVAVVDGALARDLPETFEGHSTRFALSGSAEVRHRVEVCSLASFLRGRIGLDSRDPMSVTDWLSLTGQAVLEVRGGPVFADPTGELNRARTALAWYPDDLWRYVVASAWVRLDQELPLLGRAGERGDDLGSRVIAARLVGVAQHLGFLLERRWAPYPKWRGTLFASLPRAAGSEPALTGALTATSWQDRQDRLAAALDHLLTVQEGTPLATGGGTAGGHPPAAGATSPFWERPYRQVTPGLVTALLAPVRDPDVRGLRLGLGSAEQRSDNVDLLVDPDRRRALVTEPA